jgi:hypothetical protein
MTGGLRAWTNFVHEDGVRDSRCVSRCSEISGCGIPPTARGTGQAWVDAEFAGAPEPLSIACLLAFLRRTGIPACDASLRRVSSPVPSFENLTDHRFDGSGHAGRAWMRSGRRRENAARCQPELGGECVPKRELGNENEERAEPARHCVPGRSWARAAREPCAADPRRARPDPGVRHVRCAGHVRCRGSGGCDGSDRCGGQSRHESYPRTVAPGDSARGGNAAQAGSTAPVD